MVTLISSLEYTGPERRRRAHISDSQFGEISAKVADSERIQLIDQRITRINESLGRGELRMSTMAGALEETRAKLGETRDELTRNTATTEQIATDTQVMRELLETGRALFRFASGFGRFARWAGGIAAAAAAIWGAWTGIRPPGA